nr:pentatricopeptide repeat-containing protein At5g57250, mitochondrial [Ipomoea batatas]
MITTKLHTALKLPKRCSLPSLPTLLKSGFTPTLGDFNRFLLFLSRTKRFSAINHFIFQMQTNKLKGNSQTHAILTKALLRDKKFEEAALFAKTQIVKTPNSSHRSQILDSLVQGLCITEPEMALSVLRDCLRIDGVVPSSYTLCSLLYRLCSFGMMDGATQVLELMSDERISYPFDNFVCSCVISAFVSVGKPELAVRFYSNAVKSGSLKPNVITCTSVMSAYCRLGRVKEVYSLVDMLGRNGLELDGVFYSNWIHGYFSEGMIQDALERYREMVEGSTELDTVCYTILIDGFSKEGIVEKAVGFLYKMRKDGIEPNLVTYTAIMQGFCKKGKLEEAFSVFKMAEDLGTEMDEFPYVILIDGVCRKGDYHRALKLLDEMEKKGVKPSVITYNAIINGLCKAGRTAEADDVSKGIVGDVITYSTLLHGYIQEKNVMGILETRRRLEAADVCLDVAMCNLLIKGLFMMGLFEDGHSIYKRMQEIGLEADAVTYSTMINGYSKADQIDVALEIFDQFRKKSISSDACHNCIIQWLCRKGMVDMAVEVFLELIERDFGLNTAIYRMVIKAIFQDKGAEGVLNLIHRLENFAHEIFDPICNIAICFLCKKGGLEAACNVLIKLERKGSTVNSKSYYLILKALLFDGLSLLSRQILTTFIKKYGMYDLRVNKILVSFLCMNDVNLALSFLAKGSLNVALPAAVLRTLAKNGQVLDAYRLITEAGSSFPVMDVADYSIVIDGLCKGGQIGWALNLCDFAMSKAVPLNVITYNSVINGLCRQGFLLEAFRIFGSMEKNGIYPSEITYGTLIDALIKEGLLQDSILLFEKMLCKNIPLNIHVYNSVINVYTKLGDVQNAMELLHDIEAKGLKPDEFTVSTLINGYCQKGDMEGALGLFAEFKGKSISPDFLGFMYLIRGLCAKGRMEESRCILREMLQTQSVTNMLDRVEAETKADSLKSFVSLLCEQGSIDEAVSILNEVGCMYFPVDKGHSAFNNISEKPKEPCDREAIDAVECKVTISESKSCNNGQLEMDLENDTDLEANIFHLENFGSYYSLIALYCSKGELNKANILAKKIMSFL